MAEKGGRQERLSPDYAANVRMMDDILRVRDNFDVIRKDMQIGRDRITLYYIDGFVKDSVMEKLMIFSNIFSSWQMNRRFLQVLLPVIPAIHRMIKIQWNQKYIGRIPEVSKLSYRSIRKYE